MIEQPLTFKSKLELAAKSELGLTASIDPSLRASQSGIEPSTCVDAEPYALQVLDDSMDPEFWLGAIILIDPTGRATHGSYVLAKHGEDYLFRQLRQHSDGSYTLEALNSSFPSTKTDASLSDIVGVIVQRAGKRRHQHKRYG